MKYKYINYLKLMIAFCVTKVYYKCILGAVGKKSIIYKPYLLNNPKNILIGSHSCIRKNSRLEVITEINRFACLRIGDYVNIEQNVHIVCGNNIKIGDNVSITANCAIVDISHPYFDIQVKTKIGSRLDCSRSLEIGDGSFIGIGSVILPGAHIGKNSIIGANSVVTKPIPDYCIAAGNPARVIKKYDFDKNEWIKV